MPDLALQRYLVLAERFEVFNELAPNFDLIPWPILSVPEDVRVHDIEWDAVEAFFLAAKSKMSAADYKVLVWATMICFHQDRWAARRILRTAGELEREAMTRAALKVVQVASSLYDELQHGKASMHRSSIERVLAHVMLQAASLGPGL